MHTDTLNLEHIKVILGHSKLARKSKKAYRRMKWRKNRHVVAIWVLFYLAPLEVILASVHALFPVYCTIVHYVICVH